jgi:tRNA(fMet)-specific endonuclease VapC
VYLLDTNIISTFLDQRRNNRSLVNRLLREPPNHLFISIITVEEIMRGALAAVERYKHQPSIVEKYGIFEELFNDLHRFNLVAYDTNAQQVFQAMTAAQKRIGVRDCRIAATAIALDYTIVTANVQDFQKIGGVSIEDWTI